MSKTEVAEYALTSFTSAKGETYTLHIPVMNVSTFVELAGSERNADLLLQDSQRKRSIAAFEKAIENGDSPVKAQAAALKVSIVSRRMVRAALEREKIEARANVLNQVERLLKENKVEEATKLLAAHKG